ncbi:HTH domain-containing protein [uncultured Cetobacterium sp.]|uniref:HTH domain-containing protein n=1 Tax=uncultured Cetobacterium sp. TaxID=527638 RepID=UPI0025D7665D|nr:HTH domain-containing protein [uncultured Cetobacterium sp.]
MKLDMSTKHLRVLNLLKFTDGKDLEFIKTLMNISKPNLNNYLKDIHKNISSNEKTGKMDLIITDIIEKKDLYSSLQEKQTISKEDRVFFLILKLLIEGNLNLYYLAEILNVSRRTLNMDLVSIKEELNIFELKIESHTGKGIFLDGEVVNKRNALCCYIYKYLVEEEYLPIIFSENFKYIKEDYEISSQLNSDIEKIMVDFKFDMFFYNRILLSSFYISFKYIRFDNDLYNNTNTLEIILKDKFMFETYFSKAFSNEELPKFYNFLHSSLFKNISIDYIRGFLNILKICRGTFPEESIYLKDHFLIWKKIIKTSLNIDVSDDKKELLKNFIQRVIFCSKQKHYLSIYEFYFLNLNLDNYTSTRCISLFKEFRKSYWNISFTDVLAIYFILNTQQTTSSKEITVVYKNIPVYILENMKEKLQYKYNVTIKEFVNAYFFEDYCKNNKLSTIGILGDLKLFKDLDENLKKFDILHLNLKV